MTTAPGAATSLRRTEIVLPAASLGPVNPLPPLASLQEIHDVENVDELPADLAAAVQYGRLASTLPYLLQDSYDRELVPRALSALVLENDRLRATVLPGLGGRLYSLWDKLNGRELLFRNPVFQPANLALRNAWFAGGVEWNLGSTGHTTLTCAPMHAGSLPGPDGSPVLRLWEWERTRDLGHQVDFWLPPGSSLLFVGVRIRNPWPHDVPAYWWSNIAVSQTPDTRILVPAKEAWHFDYTRKLSLVPVTEDLLRPMRHTDAADFFFEIPEGEPPWIAVVDGSGNGLIQASTARLRGRKLFVWGEGPGGRRWQEWLAPGADGHGYCEIQAGLARTQLEHLPLPGNTSWDWLEAYGPYGSVPDLEDRQQEWRSVADVEPVERLHQGSGWGALELAREELVLPGTPFVEADLGPEQEPWLALLDGRFLDGEAPGSSLVAAPWRALLEAAEETWLSSYHLGVARWHAGERDAAIAAWRRSAALAPSPWALRNLGVATGDPDLLVAAYELAPELLPLVIEMANALLDAGRVDEAGVVLERARARWPEHGRLALLSARARLRAGDLHAARQVFDDGFELADLREGEALLTETWCALAGSEPLPARYDFRMSSSA